MSAGRLCQDGSADWSVLADITRRARGAVQVGNVRAVVVMGLHEINTRPENK